LKAITTTPNLANDSTGAILLLNGTQLGSDIDKRIARRVRMTRLEMKLQAYATATTGLDQFCRLLVVLDKQPNGAALAITDVLENATTTGLVNLSNRSRFTVLTDQIHYLNSSVEPNSGKAIYRALSVGATTWYNSGNAGTVADITTNSLYLIAIGSLVAGNTAGSVTGKVRLYFYDE